ncbi:heavy metal translocating P-type ATPase [Helicobacter cappadocius]|uniref:P-type Zn(2+) transporter n=1 Tax=Helicobacter cappadocius TaxID=3063998 RepID=A0AA90SSI6_9HELI|nr:MULTISPECIES: heavy metal translocating P-type ATPase [unclassified Helicobacter]MDO7252881.1 heavy metal translocating P-type ATPase [Helicobacter sp. faydin-H75]MDP2538924.1 heavy metal translocating P-type ATPase [Helicobacter sp. faydin-H76]
MQKYNIQNLDCADCANKLENKLREIDGFSECTVSFATNTLYAPNMNIEKLREIIKKIEPKVSVNEDFENNEEKPRWEIIAGLIGIFFISLLLLHFFETQWINVISYILLGLVYLISGKSVFIGAYENFKKKQFFDENVLMLTATIAAFFIGAYQEAVSVMLFFATGEFLQDLAVSKSKSSIKSLLDLAPNIAYVKKNNQIIQVIPQKLCIGDVIIIKPGEKIPTDGTVIKGESSIDQKALTGESVPISVRSGEKVLGGSINLEGSIEIQVDKLYEDSSVAKIIELVQNAASRKSKTEKFITVFARYYTPIVFFIALCVAFVPPIMGLGSFQDWIYRGLVALMVSCPCALVISIPLGYFGGIGAASKNGILIKGANDLETLSLVKNIAFDKTGTLTKGVFKVTEVVAYNGYSKNDVLRYASCAQNLSNHPIAISIKQAYNDENHTHQIEEFEEISGYGIRVVCNSNLILAGNDKILHKYNIPHDNCSVEGTVAHIAKNGEYIGYIIISDELKTDAIAGIKELKSLGIENITILSGDNAYATQKVANAIGCKYFANLLPEDKAKIFEELKTSTNFKSAFIGDGINDAPTLAIADVGISMGGASDLSKESADIIITNNSILSISKAFKIAKKTKIIIWQNIVFALVIKTIFIILGLFGIATLWEAVFGDVGVALIALANAMRTMRI